MKGSILNLAGAPVARDHLVRSAHYHSLRHLCTLAAGMMQGAGEQYGERVTVVRTTCLDDGEDHGTFRCTFRRAVEGG